MLAVLFIAVPVPPAPRHRPHVRDVRDVARCRATKDRTQTN